MKKITVALFLYLAVLFGFGCTATFFPAIADAPLVMLDEFVPYPANGGQEWIELLNPSQTTALDLTGYRLVIHQGPEDNYTYFYEQNLSGSVPRGGFLSFTVGTGNTIPNDGACLVIFRDDTNSVYAIKYGNGTCDAGAGEQNASAVSIEQGKSIYYNLDEETWNSASTPTRGWCNPGSGSCPTISTITSQMTADNVATNLGDQTDFSRITNLYFQKSGVGETIGRITFLAEMNFTDQDALTWMQSLDTKLSISQGAIALDADLIKNLTNTQASLTMYNITLSNPKILVDGLDDASGITSGLTYDRTAHTLTFTAAHFTTFTAAEITSSSSSSSSSGSPGAAACGDWPPLNIPNLFQIDTTGTSATLYFTPVTNYLSYYFIAYGHKEGDWQFGTQFNSTQKIGVVSHQINALKPNTRYFFQVRGGNGCAPGSWSKPLAAKTESLNTAVKIDPIAKKLPSTLNPTLSPDPTPEQIVPPPENTVSVTPEENLSLWQKIKKFLDQLFN